MSSWAEIRGKIIVRDKFRDTFEPIALRADWANSSDILFSYMSENDEYRKYRNMWGGVFCGEGWEESTQPGGEYELSYNAESGLWVFSAHWNERNDTINDYFEDFQDYIVPYIAEDIIEFDCWSEFGSSDGNYPYGQYNSIRNLMLMRMNYVKEIGDDQYIEEVKRAWGIIR